jgi:hypothetical protein
MPQNLINTVFPVAQGFDSVPKDARPPFSPGAGSNNAHPAGVEANTQAPGIGLPTQVPSFTRT